MQPAKISFEIGQKIVHGKYNACHKIGEGQNSIVYTVALKRKGKEIIRAIKAQHEMVKYPQINNEIVVLKSIQEIPGADIGFPRFFEYGSEREYNYMIMELLGPNLQHLLKLSGGKLSMKSTLIIGLQILDRLEILHNAGWVYRDIQPENFVMGLENKSPIVHMIDFGKCKRYRSKQGTHLPYKENTRFDGDVLFSSLNTHNKTQYSRRDDIQALIYMMIYLRKGKLPWSIAREFKTRKERQSAIEQLKKRVPPEHLAFKMPLQFIDLLTYVRTLNYYQRPDYDYIRTILHRSFDHQQDNVNIVFDWSKMDNLDFAIYTGQPKIVQINQSQKQQNENDAQQDEKQQIKQSNTLDAQLLKNKQQNNSQEDLNQQQEKESKLFDFLNNYQ